MKAGRKEIQRMAAGLSLVGIAMKSTLHLLPGLILLAALSLSCRFSAAAPTPLAASPTGLPAATRTPARSSPTKTFPPQPSATPLPTAALPPSPLLAAPEFPTYPGEILPVPPGPITSGNAVQIELLGLWGAGPANGLVYAPDGASLAAVFAGGLALHDLQNGGEPRRFRTSGLTTSAAFASSGRLLATGVQDGRVIFWNTEKAIQLLESYSGGSPVLSLAFSPDDRLLAAGLQDGQILVFSAADGELEASLATQASEIDSLVFIPLEAGRALLAAKYSLSSESGPSGTEIGLWLLQGEPLQAELAGVLQGHFAELLSLAFCAACQAEDGSLLLASSAGDSSVLLWRLSLQGEQVGGESTRFSLPPHAETVHGLSFSPLSDDSGAGFLLAGGADSGRVVLWGLDGQIMAESAPPETPDETLPAVHHTAFNPAPLSAGELSLAALDAQGRLQILSAPGLDLLQDFDAPQQAYGNALAFSPDGSSLASALSPPAALADEWPVMARQGFQAAYAPGHTAPGQTAPGQTAPGQTAPGQTAPGQTAPFLAAPAQAGTGAAAPVTLWQLADGGLIQTFDFEFSAAYYELSFSPDGRLLAAGLAAAQVPVWQVQAGEGAMNVAPLFAPEIDQGQAAAVAFSPDSRTLAVSSGASVQLFSAAGGSAVGLLEDLGGPVEALAYSPDGALLAAGGGSELQLWDPAAQTMLVALEGHTGAILDLKFSPGGRWLASAAADQTILFWDIPAILDGAPPSPTSVIYAHDAEVFCLAFSPDGSLLASGGLDRRVRLWAVPLQGDLPLTGAWLPLGSIVGFEGMPGSLAFSPDGRYLAAAAWDGLLRLYGLPPE